jgi:hypothetical protein
MNYLAVGTAAEVAGTEEEEGEEEKRRGIKLRRRS